MLRVKLKEEIITLDSETWKAGVSYLANRTDDGRIRVYFPGSPVSMLVPADMVEIVKETKGGLA